MNDNRGEMAPVDVTLNEIESEGSHFQLISHLKLEGVPSVHKYKCLRTGINIVFSDAEDPIVEGYFTLGNILVVFYFVFIYLQILLRPTTVCVQVICLRYGRLSSYNERGFYWFWVIS